MRKYSQDSCAFGGTHRCAKLDVGREVLDGKIARIKNSPKERRSKLDRRGGVPREYENHPTPCTSSCQNCPEKAKMTYLQSSLAGILAKSTTKLIAGGQNSQKKKLGESRPQIARNFVQGKFSLGGGWRGGPGVTKCHHRVGKCTIFYLQKL